MKSPAYLTALLAGLLLSAPVLASAPAEPEANLEEVMAGPPEIDYYPLEPDFTTNLAGVGHRGKLHYLRVKVVVMLRDKNDVDEVKKREPLMRDAVVGIINLKPFQEASGSEGRETLRAECRKKITEIIDGQMGKPVVQDVLFLNYLYQ